MVLYETLVIGTRWLMRSGSVAAAGEGVELGKRAIAATMILTIGFAVGLFVLLPLFLAQITARATVNGDPLIQHLYEGVIRVLIFVGYLLVVGSFGDVKRVFRYHGAEHMTIHALEHEDALTIENIRRYPTAHPRCGTEFLVVFVIVSIIVFSLLAGQNLIVSIVGRILLIPVIASGQLRAAAVRREVQPFPAHPLDLQAGHLAAAHHHQAARRLDDRGRRGVHAGGHRGQRRDGTPGQPGPRTPADGHGHGPHRRDRRGAGGGGDAVRSERLATVPSTGTEPSES